jgi:putative endonuclease
VGETATPSKNPRHALGRRGEQLAAQHLRARGFRLLARNARTPRGEIDLIAFDRATLVFAEVKTRRVSRTSGPPHEDQLPLAGLRPVQRARLRRLAAAWLAEHRGSRPYAREIRFDAIGVLVDPTGRLLEIEHVENAW